MRPSINSAPKTTVPPSPIRLLFLGAVCALFLFIGGCSGGSETRGDPPDTASRDTNSTTEQQLPYDPAIPGSCADIDAARERGDSGSSVGCLFYPVILPNDSLADDSCALVVSNPQPGTQARVQILGGNGDWWINFDAVTIDPMDASTTFVPCQPVASLPRETIGIKGAYKIVSDTPVSVYQLNPFDQHSATTDASLVLPEWTLGHQYDVVVWEDSATKYFTVVATKNGTEVTVTPPPSVVVEADTDSSGSYSVSLGEGDTYTFRGEIGEPLTGTRLESEPDHPVALFVGDVCTFLPSDRAYCDHLEEQIPATQFWGTEFVAARVPVRRPELNPGEPVIWQVYFGADNTRLELDAHSSISGLPNPETVYQRGDTVVFTVTSIDETNPGDFHLRAVDALGSSAAKPIVLLQYMTSAQNIAPELNGTLNEPRDGDPAMIYMSPTQQLLTRYTVVAPKSWDNDALVITRHKGIPVTLDGELIDDTAFTPVGSTEFEVARVTPTPSGLNRASALHTIASQDEMFGVGVLVVGWDEHDSYAYAGGLGLTPLDLLL